MADPLHSSIVHHPPYHLPRVLIVLGSLWLIGSWAIAIGLQPPVQQTSASYEPGVRVMLLGLTAGFVIGWPLMRLSQAAIAAPPITSARLTIALSLKPGKRTATVK